MSVYVGIFRSYRGMGTRKFINSILLQLDFISTAHFSCFFLTFVTKSRLILELANATDLFMLQRFCNQSVQGWIGYTGTQVPMFVHKLGLIKPRQT